MLGLIISLIIIGLIAGALARLIIPGKQDLSIPMTIVIGIIGSFVGGLPGLLESSTRTVASFSHPGSSAPSSVPLSCCSSGPVSGAGAAFAVEFENERGRQGRAA